MKILVQTQQEAITLAQSLLIYVKDGLKTAGYIVERTNEATYYTSQRQFLRSLEKWLKERE